MNFYRKKPDPDVVSLKERFEAAKKYDKPADHYMALSDVYLDSFKALTERTLGSLDPDIYYPNIMRTSGVGIVVGGIIGAIFAPQVVAGIAVCAVLGFGAGTIAEFARLSISGRMDKKKKELTGLVEDIQKSFTAKDSDLTLQELQQSPLFENFSKKYPDLIDSFRMAALRKEQDANIAKPQPEAPKPPPGLTL